MARHWLWMLNPTKTSCRPTTKRFLLWSAAAAVSSVSTTLPAASAALHVVVITGSSRTEGPPRPIVGPRVGQFIINHLEERRRGDDEDDIQQVSLLDPRTLDLPMLQKPAFAYPKSQIPTQLQQIQDTLTSADAYIMITPEYNHAPSPALLNLLNHFGSSVFSYKPSAIVSYSAGQWGGTRAAIALRPILSELGCLPVSAMVHIPHAQDVLQEDGTVAIQQEQSSWNQYVDRCVSQLVWWGQAAKQQRAKVDPFAQSPAFSKHPSQRNAPN